MQNFFHRKQENGRIGGRGTGSRRTEDQEKGEAEEQENGEAEERGNRRTGKKKGETEEQGNRSTGKQEKGKQKKGGARERGAGKRRSRRMGKQKKGETGERGSRRRGGRGAGEQENGEAEERGSRRTGKRENGETGKAAHRFSECRRRAFTVYTVYIFISVFRSSRRRFAPRQWLHAPELPRERPRRRNCRTRQALPDRCSCRPP